MSLFISWVLFPLLFALLCLGCGLLAELIAAVRLNGVLLLPLGLAVIVVAAQLATNWDATAELATPLVLLLAVAGLVLARQRLRSLIVDRTAALAALAVFAVLAAPVVLSGEATFAGYNLNGEPSIHFIGIDRMMEHGRSISSLPPSSYQLCLQSFFGNGYPSGAQTALGSARPFVGQDVAWVYQPFLALMIALTALALYALVAPLVKRRLHRAIVVVVAAQPALVYAYTLQGSLKEVATVWIVTLLVALAVEFFRSPARIRSVIPLAVASAASLGVINVAVLPWLGLVMIATLGLALTARPRREWTQVARQAAAFLVITAVLAYPPISVADSLYSAANEQLTAQGNLTAASGLGNLAAPLKKAQVIGIWLNGDYRYPPSGTDHDITYALIVIAVLSGAVGLAWAIRRRALGPLLYFAVSVIAGAYVVRRGSPWADGKAMMITSPAVMLAIMLGPAALAEESRRRRWMAAAAALAGLLALGVLWSNALAYHDANLAPRDRLVALKAVGDRIGGEGPAVYFEFEEYGKHFLRRANPEGRSEACEARFVRQRNGQFPTYGFSAEPDLQTLPYLLYYRTIVLRRSPSLSRPPSIYRLTYTNRYYEVWQRPVRPETRVVEHLPVQGPEGATARPVCADVRRLARRARGIGARIAYVPRPAATVWIPAHSILPRAWTVDPSEGHVVIPNGPGRVQDSVRLPAAGIYNLWLGGSFGRGFEVLVDGHRVGDVGYELNGRDQFHFVGRLRLGAGKHEVALLRGGGDLRPGNGGAIRSLGPLEFEPPSAQQRTVRYVLPSRAGSLCGRDLDWVEIVRS